LYKLYEARRTHKLPRDGLLFQAQVLSVPGIPGYFFLAGRLDGSILLSIAQGRVKIPLSEPSHPNLHPSHFCYQHAVSKKGHLLRHY
jgi:hypothetical protein